MIRCILELNSGNFADHVRQVFSNLAAIAEAAGGTLNDFVKVTVFLTDLNNFATVNTVMEEFFTQPYPARAAVQVSAFPKGLQ